MSAWAIRTMWQSGFVNRWHSNPDPRLRNSGDTTAAHSQRVATLVALLLPHVARGASQPATEASLLRSALWHDAPESYTGDVPRMAKMELSYDFDTLESTWWESLGVDEPEPSALVKLCDDIDAIMFAGHVAPDVRLERDWMNYRSATLARAEEMGVGDLVRELLW